MVPRGYLDTTRRPPAEKSPIASLSEDRLSRRGNGTRHVAAEYSKLSEYTPRTFFRHAGFGGAPESPLKVG